MSGTTDHLILLSLAASVYMYIKLHLSRYPHSVPELLTAFAAQLVRRQPDDVPGLYRPAGRTRRIQDAATAEL